MCVYGALIHKYNFDEDDLFKIFTESLKNNVNHDRAIELKKTDGVTTEMILYLAKIKNFSVYGLDWRNNLLVKQLATNQHKKPLCYQINNDHFYLMTEEYAIHVSKQNADKSKKIMSSSLFRDYEIKNTFELTICNHVNLSLNVLDDIINLSLTVSEVPDVTKFPMNENIEIDKLEYYSQCNVIYSNDNYIKLF